MNVESEPLPPISEEDLEHSIIQRFERVVSSRPNELAIAAESESVTYQELADYVDYLAHEIVGSSQPGDRVAVLGRASVQLIAAVLAVLKTGRYLVVLHVDDAKERLEFILRNAESSLLLTTDECKELTRTVALPRQRVLRIELRKLSSARAALPYPTADGPAAIVYTSGSVGAPKGVVGSQRCLHSKAYRLSACLGYRSDDRHALLYALSTGGGLNITLAALLSGAELHIYPTWRKGDEGLAPWLLAREITFLSCASSGFRHFSRSLEKGQRFPFLRRIRLGFESVLPDDYFRWRDLAPEGANLCVTLSCTEAGLISHLSLDHSAEVSATGAFSSGRPGPGMEIRLEDDQGLPSASGEVGEIVVRSRFLASSYWNLPELTREKFRELEDGLREYRTGDLGRMRPDGTLEHRGRKDGQVKIRGYRIEFAEVEGALLAVSGARSVAAGLIHNATSIQVGDPPTSLGAFIVVEPGGAIDEKQLRGAMAERVPSYMVPARFYAVDTLPTKINGKIDRGALAELAQTLDQDRQPQTHRDLSPTEDIVAGFWRGILRQTTVSPDDDFLALGGDSLSSAVLIAQIQRHFGLELDLRFVADFPMVASMAAEIDHRLGGGAVEDDIPLVRIPRGGPLPVPFEQERIARACQSVGNAPYMLRNGTTLSGPLDRECLKRSLQALVERHEYLHSSFHLDKTGVTQQVHPPRLSLHSIDLRSHGEDAPNVAYTFLKRIHRKGIRLDRPPLMRFVLARLGEEDWVLMTAVHHILLDSTAWDIVHGDLAAIYSSLHLGRPELLPEPLKIQMADYAAWQRAKFGPGSPQREPTLAWWREAFRDAPVPRLPSLRKEPRPDEPFDGCRISKRRHPDTNAAIEKLRHQEGVTTYILGLAALRAHLALHGNLSDVVLGTYVSQRTRTETLRLVGDFANFLALRIRISSLEGLTFRDLLRDTRQAFIDSRARAEISFDDVCADLRQNQITPPDVQFIYSSKPPHVPFEFAGLSCVPRVRTAKATATKPQTKLSRMPWRCTFTFSHKAEGLHWHAEFDTRLHSRSVMDVFVDGLLEMTIAAASYPDGILEKLDILSKLPTPEVPTAKTMAI